MVKTVLFIGATWPEPASTAAGSRMVQLFSFFNNLGATLHFASTAAKNDFSVDLNAFNIASHHITLNHSSFDAFVRELKPCLVIFDRFMIEEQFGWRVAQHCSTALRILDTEDLHCLRTARASALKKNEPFTLQHLHNNIAKREIASILRCDLSLIISSYEMALLTDFFKIDTSLLLYFPFVNLNPERSKNVMGYHARTNFISIGNFLHEPNLDAVHHLKSSIWPKIKKELPEANLLVYGAYLPEKIKHYHNKKDGFLLMGRAPSVEQVMLSARICLAPLRFGAGLKGKLFDCMMYGLPNITTSIGAEGMHNQQPWNGYISDDEDVFVEQAIAYYKNQELWETAQKNGFALLEQMFATKPHFNVFETMLESLSNSLAEHRSKNFIGQILQTQTLNSFKYMALWIEEKNKNIQ